MSSRPIDQYTAALLEANRAAQIDAQLQVDALLSRIAREESRRRTDHFEEIPRELGRFWLAWISLYVGVCIVAARVVILGHV